MISSSNFHITDGGTVLVRDTQLQLNQLSKKKAARSVKLYLSCTQRCHSSDSTRWFIALCTQCPVVAALLDYTVWSVVCIPAALPDVVTFIHTLTVIEHRENNHSKVQVAGSVSARMDGCKTDEVIWGYFSIVCLYMMSFSLNISIWLI